MSRPQPGMVLPARNYYRMQNLKNLAPGLNSMNLAKTAARMPALVSEWCQTYPEANLVYTLAFSCSLWSLINHARMPKGFSISVSGGSEKKTLYSQGDLMVFLGSQDKEVLGYAFSQFQIPLEGMIESIEDSGLFVPQEEETILKFSPNSGCSSTISFGLEEPEFMASHYIAVLKMAKAPEASIDPGAEFDNQLVARIIFNSLKNFPIVRNFYSADPKAMLFLGCAKSLNVLEQWMEWIANEISKSIKNKDLLSQVIPTKSIFFSPSLDLLLGFRLGGVRMGDLSPTAPWK